jgi:hypothetical protein
LLVPRCLLILRYLPAVRAAPSCGAVKHGEYVANLKKAKKNMKVDQKKER